MNRLPRTGVYQVKHTTVFNYDDNVEPGYCVINAMNRCQNYELTESMMDCIKELLRNTQYAQELCIKVASLHSNVVVVDEESGKAYVINEFEGQMTFKLMITTLKMELSGQHVAN